MLPVSHPTLTAQAQEVGAAAAPAALAARPAEQPPAAPLDRPSGQQSLTTQATLELRQQTVETSPPMATDWMPAQALQPVTVGYRVRTGPSGAARLIYYEGSTTEISPNTGILVQELEQHPGRSPGVRLLQAAGTTLSRVGQLLDGAARFEIETPAATAHVRGTWPSVSQISPERWRFQNRTPTGADPMYVCPLGTPLDLILVACVQLLAGQEVDALVGTGPSGGAGPIGSSGQNIARQTQRLRDQQANHQARMLAQGMSQAVLPGLQVSQWIQTTQQAQSAQLPQILQQGTSPQTSSQPQPTSPPPASPTSSPSS
jgi:hypothetical protein